VKVVSPLPRRRSRIEIIPLIDVMFFLLAAFMMVSLNMSKLTAVKVDAPVAATGEKDIKEDIFNIAVDKAGTIFLGDTPASLVELRTVLSNRFGEGRREIPVYVTGDRETPHGMVVGVLEAVRRAGIQRVSFAVTPPPE
jgi:biopolymer transport protein ExbD